MDSARQRRILPYCVQDKSWKYFDGFLKLMNVTINDIFLQIAALAEICCSEMNRRGSIPVKNVRAGDKTKLLLVHQILLSNRSLQIQYI